MSDTDSTNDAQKIPPKLVIRPQAAGAAPEGDSSPAQMKKRETSKISLDAAIPSDEGPKTIRLKPPAATGGIRAPKPGIITQSPVMQASPVSEKRKTSRISLEAALAPEAGAASEAPKTIRLKKPSEAVTVKVGKSTPEKSDTAPVEKAALSKTSEISDVDAAPVTQRRTIRVKRAGGKGEVSVKGQRAAEGDSSEADAPAIEGEPVKVRDEPNWFFVFSSVAAVLIACVIIYVFTSQAFGPNSSLTRLSYGAPELDLGWPGKIIGSR